MKLGFGLVWSVGGFLLLACGSDGRSPSGGGSGGDAGFGTGAVAGQSGAGGGLATGGALVNGGASAAAGASGSASASGAAGVSGTAGAAGTASAGGAAGAAGTAGAAVGGGMATAGSAAEAGESAGGVAAGGEAAGGVAAGGEQTGGVPSTGGTTTGGTATGGTATGGTIAEGGAGGDGGEDTGPPPGECRIGFPGPPLLAVAGDLPSSTSFADLDGDGLLDMVVTGKDGSHATGLVSVFMNTPKGYGARHDFDTGGSPSSASIADVDGDTDLDVVVASEGNPGSVSVLLNQGGGVLAEPVSYGPGCNYAISLSLGDLNGDKKPDVAVACWLNATVEVRLNDGNGGFGTKTTYNSPEMPWAPTGVAAGDVDGDGDADLVATDDRDGRVSVFANAGDGTFAAPVHYDASDRPVAIALGDVNGDKKLDIALASAGGYGLDVLLNQGGGVFGAHQTYEIFSYLYNPSSVALRDINGDGMLDAALATNNGLGIAVTFLNQGDGSFALDSATDLSGLGVSTSLRDATGDNVDDLVVGVESQMDLSNASVAVYPGLAGGTYATQIEFPTSAGFCNSLVTGDFDGDGKLDMATGCNGGQGDLNVWYGAGDGSFSRVDHPFGFIYLSLASGDLNGDGLTDIIDQSGGSTNNDIAVMLAQPGRKFTSTWYAAADGDVDAANVDAAIGDLDDDGDLDFVVGNIGLKTIRVFFNAGDGTFPVHVDYAVNHVAERMAIGDIDGDGTPDVVFNTTPSGVSIFSNDGTGTLTYEGDVPTGPDPTGIAIADLDGDHRNDLVVSNSDFGTYYNSNVTVLTNQGDFVFTGKDFLVREDPGSLSTGDLDGDGLLDIVVSDGGGSAVSVLFNQGNGDYVNRVWPVTEYPGASVIRDLNGDGRPDIAVISYEAGLRVLPQWCW